MGELSLDLHLIHARLDEPANAAKTRLSDRAGPAQQLELSLRFHGPQSVHQPRQSLVIVKRIGFLRFCDEARLPRFDDNRRALVLV